MKQERINLQKIKKTQKLWLLQLLKKLAKNKENAKTMIEEDIWTKVTAECKKLKAERRKTKKSRHINSKIKKRRNSCIIKFVIYQYSIQANLTTMKMHILSKNISNDKNNYWIENLEWNYSHDERIPWSKRL